MKQSIFDISDELKKLPSKPGVYLMCDQNDQVIYVGKAIQLRSRVRQYFQSSRNKGVKIEQMITQIRRFEYIVTDSELEALVLECNLIKEHHPKYNTMLMDDKAYPFIKVTTEEVFPRVLFARKTVRDKAKYFGPYASAGKVRDTIDLVRRLYHIRNCNRNLPRDMGKERPCLNYHIKQCYAPCQGYISPEEYREAIAQVLLFLGGYYDNIINHLTCQMEEASDEMEFERAMEYRDLLGSVREIAQKQKITDLSGEDRDVLAVAKDDTDAVVQVFFIRGGKLIGREHFYLRTSLEEDEAQVLEHFIKQYYGGTPFVPGELMLPTIVGDMKLLEEWLSEKRGGKVILRVPQKGTKEKLMEMAITNAQLVLSKDKERLKREEKRTVGAVKELEELLQLEQIERMEAYDISNISGFATVGSMVVYQEGKPKRSDYRKFRIKGVEGADDYGSLREMLLRRFSHGLKNQEKDIKTGSFTVFPDLILMDGGKGQVNIALKVLEELDLDIPVCGLVKDDQHRTRGLYYHNQEITMNKRGEGFQLLARIQNEAHRFAIDYHRQLRGKGQVHSLLDDIEGIGPTRRKALMRYFSNLEEIKEASEEKLAGIPGMNKKAAHSVYTFFNHQSFNKGG